jgi:outer membrane receptor protein involved in Fe transport
MDTFDPEELTAYQVGSRNRFADGRVQLNAEVFYWDYKDQQIGHVVFDPVGNINFVTDNAGQATIQGANLDLVAAITDNDRVELFVEYNDTDYDEFTYETAYSIFGAPVFQSRLDACPFSAPFPGRASARCSPRSTAAARSCRAHRSGSPRPPTSTRSASTTARA